MSVASERLAGITILNGTDAGGVRIVPDGHGGWRIIKVPGWNPESMFELANSLEVISAASRLKTSGLAEAAIKSVGGFVEKQLAEHAGGANVVVVMGR
jgi:hypothetical protein